VRWDVAAAGTWKVEERLTGLLSTMQGERAQKEISDACAQLPPRFSSRTLNRAGLLDWSASIKKSGERAKSGQEGGTKCRGGGDGL